MTFARPHAPVCLLVRADTVPLLRESVVLFQTTLFFTLSNICITLPAGMQPSLKMVIPPSQRKNKKVNS